MSDDIAARIAKQNAEFDTAKELAKQYRRIELTPVVDDDYPSVRFDYERAVRAFIDASQANGRVAQSERTRFVAPFPLPTELAAVLVEYDGITNKADRGDPEWDFVMRAADYRVIRDFFASLKREGPPTVITNPPRPA